MIGSLLSTTEWSGKALAREWKPLTGGPLDVIEPATTQPIGRVSRAAPDDVRASCAAARQAQKGWSALPYAGRAKVFRKAAELLEANRPEFATWIVRETGGIQPKAMFEIDSVLHHCHEAAAMPTQPKGLVLPSAEDGVTPEMPVFREEIFGPVVAITRFGTDAEAIALANDTEYGLSAGVYTRDVGRGMVIGERLHVGLVHVNDQTVNDDGTMPIGRRGASGNGSRHGGPANWDEFTQWQWTPVRNAAPPYPL